MKERKTATHERAWSEYPRNVGQVAPRPLATLFIEDALANLGIARDEDEELGRDVLELNRLKKDYRHRRDSGGGYPVINGASTFYPPENVRAAVDLLFLEGSSELILAKKAIVSFRPCKSNALSFISLILLKSFEISVFGLFGEHFCFCVWRESGTNVILNTSPVLVLFV